MRTSYIKLLPNYFLRIRYFFNILRHMICSRELNSVGKDNT